MGECSQSMTVEIAAHLSLEQIRTLYSNRSDETQSTPMQPMHCWDMIVSRWARLIAQQFQYSYKIRKDS